MAATLTKDQREEFERDAWRLRHLERLSHREIAARLGAHCSTVTRALQRVAETQRELFLTQAERVKLEQTAVLQAIRDEALNAWQDSRGEEIIETVTSKPEGVERKVQRRRLSRNPQLLAQAREAMADERRIWGLDSPVRQDLTSGGKPLVIREVTVELPADDDDDAGGEPEAPGP